MRTWSQPLSKLEREWWLNNFAVRTGNGVNGAVPNRKLRRAATKKQRMAR